MKILVQGATLSCTHSGTATITAGSSKLKIDGKPVVILSNLATPLLFAGCTFAPGGVNTPCNSTPPDTGISNKLKVDGQGVLLDSAAGNTSNAVRWSVQDAGQTKVEER